MKKLALLLCLVCSVGVAQEIQLERRQLGSGTPAEVTTFGNETAKSVGDGMYHAPQYLPGHPTAATIFPRTVQVPCTKGSEQLECSGYNWAPEMGRGEYLFVIPKMVEPPKQTVIREQVPVIVRERVPVIVEKEVIREVKKIRE